MDAHGFEPLFLFGFGLSYASFEYANLPISSGKIQTGQGLTVSFDVRYTGSGSGKESAQVYVAASEPCVPGPLKELKRFAKADLAPGEAKTVTVDLQDEDLARFAVSTMQWVTDPGGYNVIVGSSSRLSRSTTAFRFEERNACPAYRDSWVPLPCDADHQDLSEAAWLQLPPSG